MLAIGYDGGFSQKAGRARFLILTHHEVDLITRLRAGSEIRILTRTIDTERDTKREARIQRGRTLDLHTEPRHRIKSCGAAGTRVRR